MAFINRVDDTEVAEIRLALARDDLNLDARLPLDALDERLAILRVARCSRSHGDALRHLHDFHHMLVDVQAGQRPFHAFRIESARFRHAAPEPYGLFLLIFEMIRLIVCHLHNDETNRVRPHIDDCHSLHERNPPCLAFAA